MPEDPEVLRATVTREHPARGPEGHDADASLSNLVRQLADDGRTLVQQEIGLAKAELVDNVVSFAKRAALLAIGGAVLLVGLLVLVAFLVLGLGVLLEGRYWLSSLIVGAVLAAIGGSAMLMGRSGLRRQTLKPERTVVTLRESGDWARSEAQQIRRELTRSDGRH